MLNMPPFPGSAAFPSWTDANESRWHRWEGPEPCTPIKTEAWGKTGQETKRPSTGQSCCCGHRLSDRSPPVPRRAAAQSGASAPTEPNTNLNHTAPNLNYPEATKDRGKPADLPSTRQREGLRIKDCEKRLQDQKKVSSHRLYSDGWRHLVKKKKTYQLLLQCSLDQINSEKVFSSFFLKTKWTEFME